MISDKPGDYQDYRNQDRNEDGTQKKKKSMPFESLQKLNEGDQLLWDALMAFNRGEKDFVLIKKVEKYFGVDIQGPDTAHATCPKCHHTGPAAFMTIDHHNVLCLGCGSRWHEDNLEYWHEPLARKVMGPDGQPIDLPPELGPDNFYSGCTGYPEDPTSKAESDNLYANVGHKGETAGSIGPSLIDPCPPSHHLKCNYCQTDLEDATYRWTPIPRGEKVPLLVYWCSECLQSYLIPLTLHDHHLKKSQKTETETTLPPPTDCPKCGGEGTIMPPSNITAPLIPCDECAGTGSTDPVVIEAARQKQTAILEQLTQNREQREQVVQDIIQLLTDMVDE